MPQVNGTVTATSTKKVNTKYGEKDTFSICVDGVWYSNGFTQPTVDKGDTVTLEHDGGKYKNIISVSKTAGGGAAAPSGGGTSRGGTDVQRAIIRQNALAHATSVVLATKPAKQDRADVIKDVITAARCFEAYSNGSIDQMEESAAADAIMSQA
jgi:hypothetical protein